MRAILFGDAAAAADALEDQRTLAILESLWNDETVPAAKLPRAALDAGLFTVVGERAAPGPVVVWPPRLPEDAITTAAGQTAEMITERLPSIQAALASEQPAAADWKATGLLVIGGFLLDLCVGEELHRSKLTLPDPTPWRLWLLPPCPGISLGMRVLHDSEARIGAAVMWTDIGEPAPPLPEITDLPGLQSGVRIDPNLAVARLRLRQSGWIGQDDRGPLFIDNGGALWTAVTDLAADLVASVHTPLLRDPAFPADPPARHTVSRLVFEGALHTLVSTGAIVAEEPLARRLIWTGPNWLLSGGGESHE